MSENSKKLLGGAILYIAGIVLGYDYFVASVIFNTLGWAILYLL